MRIESISITNMRLLGKKTKELTFSKERNIVILLGDNGFGKTTVLDAVATSIAPYLMQFPGISDFQLTDMDVHINRYGKKADYLSVSAKFQSGEQMLVGTRYRKGMLTPPKANYEELKRAAIDCKDIILSGGIVELPVFAYYGTGRGQFEVPVRKRGFAQTYERWDCYKSALTPATDFKRFFGWFDLMEDEERREKERRKDWDYRLPVLNAVRNALTGLDIAFQNPRIETKPLRFVMDRVEADGSKHELRIEQMSDGYKIVISMVADLSARMAEANPHLENPLLGKGIVLIDEIDLHLHPRWQRFILLQLHKIFPNIQFIVSTHSPIIVVGAGNSAQILNLGLDDGDGMEVDGVGTENIGQVLLGELFGINSLFSPEWDDKIKERDALLAKTQLEESEQLRLRELNHDLSAISFLQSPESLKANKLLESIAKKLNISI